MVSFFGGFVLLIYAIAKHKVPSSEENYQYVKEYQDKIIVPLIRSIDKDIVYTPKEGMVFWDYLNTEHAEFMRRFTKKEVNVNEYMKEKYLTTKYYSVPLDLLQKVAVIYESNNLIKKTVNNVTIEMSQVFCSWIHGLNTQTGYTNLSYRSPTGTITDFAGVFVKILYNDSKKIAINENDKKTIKELCNKWKMAFESEMNPYTVDVSKSKRQRFIEELPNVYIKEDAIFLKFNGASICEAQNEFWWSYNSEDKTQWGWGISEDKSILYKKYYSIKSVLDLSTEIANRFFR